MDDKLVAEYANENGAAQVWKAWRDTMLSQGREVNEKFMSWPIPRRDISLDADIAFAVIDDFLVWAGAHHGLRLTRVAVDAKSVRVVDTAYCECGTCVAIRKQQGR